MKRVALVASVAWFASLAGMACGTSTSDDYSPPDIERTAKDAAIESNGEAGSEARTRDAGPCLTQFRYVPPPGKIASAVSVIGEWDNFATPGTALSGPDNDSAFVAALSLPPGLLAYKLMIDGTATLDPSAPLRKYMGGVENSAIRARDCSVPILSMKTKTDSASSFSATVLFQSHDSFLDSKSVRVVLKKDGAVARTIEPSIDASAETIDLSATGLAKGKYTIVVDAKSETGIAAEPLRLPFWIEESRFEWSDALIYMIMTDRFVDGETGNNVPLPAGLDPRAAWKGGDLEGVANEIAKGTFDKLGVRALWLSPFNTNPSGTYVADDGVHQTSGYHGYWPIKAREVDARIGGAAGLHKVVEAAHAHGIRILMDLVVNHVHKEHEYFAEHPEWFRTGCVCGTPGCDWTEKRLECLFTPYLPDVNWTVPEVSEQFAADATYWLDAFDIDGFRIDAVKHVEDLAVRNLAYALRSRFETAGTRVFLTGETAMGWSDCGVGCNQSQYDTISRYMGPFGLDGQFDFVLYHAVPYRTFSSDQKGMLHADFWAKTSQQQYPAGSVMTPYIGSHDTSRFVTLASYRGQDGAHDPGIPGSKWENIAGAPTADAYPRHRTALSWLMGLPGAPLLYYGDEYGEWGGADPNNRSMWRGNSALSIDEAATLSLARSLGTARREILAMRRGDYRSVYATEDQLVTARVDGSNVALVLINRSSSPANLAIPLPVTLPITSGTVLKAHLGGSNVTVVGGSIAVTLPAHGAEVLAP